MGFDSEIEDEKIILSFKGIADSGTINSFLNEAEDAMRKRISSPSVRKRIYAILVEVSQNLFHHTEKDLHPETNSKTAQLYMKQHDSEYLIYSRNFIKNSGIYPLKTWIDKVNSCSETELKELYLLTLQNKDYSGKGGAGLGMIDIARKTKSKLGYQFLKVNKEVAQFVFKVSYKIP